MSNQPPQNRMTSRTPLARLIKAHQISLLGDTSSNTQQLVSQFDDFVRAAPNKPSGECLLMSELEWMQEVETQSFERCREFLILVAQLIAPKPTTSAWDLLQQFTVVSSGLQELDLALNGGFRAGQLVEFVSLSGLGKSIWCLTCLAHLAVQRKCTVIYLDMERKFKHDRWTEIICALGGNGEDVNRLHVIHGDQVNDVMALVQSKVEQLFHQQHGGLACLVFDSITALSSLSTSSPEMYATLFKLACDLKALAESFHIPVLITNQQKPKSTTGGGDLEQAYLGNSWHHVVNVRLFLVQQQGVRYCKIGKSPDALEVRVPYSISTAGIISSTSQHQHQQQQEWQELFESMSQEELNALL